MCELKLNPDNADLEHRQDQTATMISTQRSSNFLGRGGKKKKIEREEMRKKNMSLQRNVLPLHKRLLGPIQSSPVLSPTNPEKKKPT